MQEGSNKSFAAPSQLMVETERRYLDEKGALRFTCNAQHRRERRGRCEFFYLKTNKIRVKISVNWNSHMPQAFSWKCGDQAKPGCAVSPARDPSFSGRNIHEVMLRMRHCPRHAETATSLPMLSAGSFFTRPIAANFARIASAASAGDMASVSMLTSGASGAS